MSGEPEWMEYARAILALVFVLGLILCAGVVARKTGLNRRLSGNRGPARLKLVETLYLGPRHRVVIMRADENEHVLLLGTAGDLLIESRKAGVHDA